jgi:quercetin 2,3-dioxygenase
MLTQTVLIRPPESIYQARGAIENGTFQGRWHFSFDTYYDPAFSHFGSLRVLNDDTLSPGAIWPLHPHREIEVVTYCAGGEFRHADEHGQGGILRKGDVQHTTVGRGMWHSEINNRDDEVMRFIQMWFIPRMPNLAPAVQQRQVEQAERTNLLLPLVSSDGLPGALPLESDGSVYSCRLLQGNRVQLPLDDLHGGYLYVLEGGPVKVNGEQAVALSAAAIIGLPQIEIEAVGDSELLLIIAGA